MDNLQSSIFLPSSAFFIVGIWWAWWALYKYYNCEMLRRNEKENSGFLSTNTFPWIFLGKKLPLEGIFITGVCVLDIIGVSYMDGLQKESLSCVMFYAFYLLYGIVLILLYYEVPLPSDSDYTMLLLASIMEGILLINYESDRVLLLVRLYLPLLYIIGAKILAIALEMALRRHVLVTLSRAFCFMLQGTWLFQIGFFICLSQEQTWNDRTYETYLTIPTIFSFHVMSNLLIIFIIGYVAYNRIKIAHQVSLHDSHDGAASLQTKSHDEFI